MAVRIFTLITRRRRRRDDRRLQRRERHGTKISDIVDNNDGSSLIYAYNPTGAVLLTSQRWSAFAPTQIVSGPTTTFAINDVDTSG